MGGAAAPGRAERRREQVAPQQRADRVAEGPAGPRLAVGGDHARRPMEMYNATSAGHTHGDRRYAGDLVEDRFSTSPAAHGSRGREIAARACTANRGRVRDQPAVERPNVQPAAGWRHSSARPTEAAVMPAPPRSGFGSEWKRDRVVRQRLAGRSSTTGLPQDQDVVARPSVAAGGRSRCGCGRPAGRSIAAPARASVIRSPGSRGLVEITRPSRSSSSRVNASSCA